MMMGSGSFMGAMKAAMMFGLIFGAAKTIFSSKVDFSTMIIGAFLYAF